MKQRIKHNLMNGAAVAFFLAVAGGALAQPRTFDVPAQSASSAIPMFARQAGLQVFAPSDGLEGVRTPALKGVIDAREALKRLIADSGLEIASDNGAVIVLRRAPAPMQKADADSAGLDQVVVTAQKRDEAAQDVPISLTAFSARSIEDFRLESLRDVSRLTPGLLVSAFNQSSPTIAIRGASNTFTQIGANKPVAVVVDDLFIPRNSAATFELYGLNSIQVLKGPQGTLFGRNVTGGAIVIDTGKPAYGQTAGSLRVGTGDYGLVQVDGLVDAPLGDKVSARLAGSYKKHDGYGYDRLTGAQEDDLDSQSLRGQLRMAPADGLDLLIGADYSQDHNGGRTLSSKGAGSDGDRRTSELGFPQDFGRTQWGGSVRAYWDFPAGQLASITGYRRSQSGEDYSGVGASYIFLTGTNTQTVNRDDDEVGTLSQELRYASPKWDHGDFVVGAYASTEAAHRYLTTTTLAAVTGARTSAVLSNQAVKTANYAVFADGTIHLPAKFDLTLGARYTHDQKRASLIRNDLIRPTNTFAIGGLSADWGEVTPRAVLSWIPSDSFRLYGSVTRGYTAGGFNTEAATAAILAKPFNPETVVNYEAGVKSQWLDNRLRFNASLFDMDYKNKQELYFDNVTRILTINNAAKATVKGLEVEATAAPVRWLSATATYGLLKTAYNNFVIPGGVVNTGNPLGSSPRNRASLAVDVHYPLAAGGVLLAAASYAYTDGYYTGATKDPNLHISAYALGNLSAGYQTPGGRWTVTLWMKNVGDADYVLTPSTQGVLAEYLGEPRTYGVMLSARY